MPMGEKLYRRAQLRVEPEREPTRALPPLAARVRSILRELAGLGLTELDGMAQDEGAGATPSPLTFLNTVAFAAPLSPEVKLGLLRENDPAARAEALVAALVSLGDLRRMLHRHRPRAAAPGVTGTAGDFSNN
jgi:hypothetical protein